MTEGDDQAVELAAPPTSSWIEAPRDEPRAPAPPPAGRTRLGLPRRPPVVRDWRWALGLLGRVFIVAGLLIFAFVAYQLWGTGIEFRANQDQLEKDFEESLLTAPATPATTAAPTTTTLPPTTTAPGSTVPGASTTTLAATTAPAPTTSAAGPTLPQFHEGDGLGKLEMPTITGTPYYLVAGVGVDDLKKGVGHFSGTPMPGQLGNAALAGHRTTYGHPFENLDDLKPGDPIVFTNLLGQRFVYVVDAAPHDHAIIKPTDTYVLAQPDDPTEATLTLTTCHPKHSTKQRYVVFAHLDLAQSAVPGPRTSNYQPVTDRNPSATTVATLPGDGGDETTTAAPVTTLAPVTTVGSATTAGSGTTTSTVPATTLAPTTSPAPTTTAVTALPGEDVPSSDARAFGRGWFHDHGAWVQITLWGLVLLAIWFVGWWVGRRASRVWLGYVVAFAPFVVGLYFFFQNVNRLLPPGL